MIRRFWRTRLDDPPMLDTRRRPHSPLRPKMSLLSLVFAASLGCSPALDWRDVRPSEGGLSLQFPCKPGSQLRRIQLAETAVDMTLYACSADGQTFGVAHADVRDPSRVNSALKELGAAAAANLRAAATTSDADAERVPGSTPSESSGRFALQGSLPDNSPARMYVALFSHGTRVYQASVLGPKVSDQTANTFFASLRLAL